MDGDTKPGAVVVSAKKRFRPFRRMAHPSGENRGKARYLFVLVLILLSVTIVASVFYLNNRKISTPALVVGTEQISQAQYDKLIVQAKKKLVSEEGAKNTIIESYKYQQAAEKFGIKIVQPELEALDGQLVTQKSVKDEFYKLGLYRSYFDLQIEMRAQDGYEGYVFYYPFSRNFLQSDPTLKASSEFMNPTAIEKDRLEARKKVESAYSRLKAKSVSPDQLLKEIREDKSLIYGNARNDSQHFIVNKEGFKLLGGGAARRVADRFIDILPAMDNGGFSKIRDDVQSYTEVQSNQWVTKNTAYYFVYKVKNIEGSIDLKERFNAELAQIKVIDNVSK